MNRSSHRVSLMVALLVPAMLGSGCASRKPSIERDPGRYAPAETDSRKVTRVEERLHLVQDRINGWTRELEAGRSRASDPERLDTAIERLHAATKDLERIRLSANDVSTRAGESEELDREVLRIQSAAEKAYRDGRVAIEGPAKRS